MTVASLIVSVLSGSMFAASWWLVIHGHAYAKYFAEANAAYKWWYYIAPLVATLGILLINMVSARVIEGEDSGWGSSSSSSSKRTTLFSFMAVLLMGMGLSVWFATTYYFADDDVESKYPGVALLSGTAGLAVCGLMFKFARTHDDEGGF